MRVEDGASQVLTVPRARSRIAGLPSPR